MMEEAVCNYKEKNWQREETHLNKVQNQLSKTGR